MNWREQLPFTAHEINEAGGVNPTMSRQEIRALMRHMAKLQVSERKIKSRDPKRQPDPEPQPFRLVYPAYTDPHYGGLAIRRANAKNGVGSAKRRVPQRQAAQ